MLDDSKWSVSLVKPRFCNHRKIFQTVIFKGSEIISIEAKIEETTKKAAVILAEAMNQKNCLTTKSPYPYKDDTTHQHGKEPTK